MNLPASELLIIAVVVGVIALTSLLPAFLLFLFWKSVWKPQQEAQQVIAHGIPAQARIIGVQDLGGSIRIMDRLPEHQFRLHLEVQPHGAAPFQATAVQLVSAFSFARIQPGATVEVRYDPTNPARVAVVL